MLKRLKEKYHGFDFNPRKGLIWIALIFQFVFNCFGKKIKKDFDKKLSLIKLCRYLQDNINVLADLIIETCRNNLKKQTLATKALLKYCTYDKRNRQNYNDQLSHFS